VSDDPLVSYSMVETGRKLSYPRKLIVPFRQIFYFLNLEIYEGDLCTICILYINKYIDTCVGL